ncbi:HNH endonuclease [Cystobacter fuscus]|uniref:HNH endonuclease n=1 Tax=Cystobacter fuscus TaxID=43 RepID=UPI002B2C1558|nr:HNH endonuclease [Cystobacter fuscus]
MRTTLSPATLIRLEKTAVDNGFDVELPRLGLWLGYASTQAPLKIWLTHFADETLFVVAFSQAHVAAALEDFGTPVVSPLPECAVAGRSVLDIPSLHGLVRRAFQLSKSLPDELLHLFEAKVASLPRTTEAERWVVQRVGQDVFREGLIDYWDGRCAVTGLAVTELLRASHIKPWADCESDAERLDIFNGLLLAPHLDAAFDGGLITVSDGGDVIVANTLPVEARRVLGLVEPLRVDKLKNGHRRYLAWHRAKVFGRDDVPPR